MFAPLQPAASRRPLWLVCSVALHAAMLGALLYRPEPPILRPSGSLRGNGGGSTLTALIAPGASVVPQEKAAPRELLKSELSKKSRQKTAPVSEPAPMPAAAQQSLRPGMPGYVLGSLASGFANDHDVRIALPVYSPDPPILRNKLPDWIRGDVIVEVTIDEQGKVTETRVLQTVGYGLEETVRATLLQWRFTPAKVDGISVASRQDVHFHFPS